MKLSPRLKAIADLISDNSSVIDVGADHGLLSIYLSKYKKCACLATDISEKCLERAKLNSVKYGAHINFKVTDGLKDIKLKDEIIVIAGMGTKNIKKILDMDINNELIIMSHTNIEQLKDFLYFKGYNVILEKEIFDRHYYTIVRAKKILF